MESMTTATLTETIVPGLTASQPAPLPFDESLHSRAFLLERPEGDIQVYSAAGVDFEPARQYLSHSHEAAFGTARGPLFVHEAERAAVAEHMPVRAAFSRRHTLDDDFEAIPTPGHTPGATAYLWHTADLRVLFTGDTVYLRGGEWRAAVLDSSDRGSYIESLLLLRELEFDVLVPWIAGAGEQPYGIATLAEARRRIDALVDRLWRGDA
jgi:glyoxylase-like metal-dependent hydrolase (beta-lactamase superfamily II)